MGSIIDKAVDHLMQNARAIKDAPLVFVAVLVLGFGGAFWLSGLRYQGALDQKQSTIDDLKTQIDGLRDQLDGLKQKLAERSPATPQVTPSRDPDALYEFGEFVAQAPSGIIDRAHGKVFFPSVLGSPNFNVHSTMDYRQFVLSDCQARMSSISASMGITTSVGYREVTCSISDAHP